MDTLGLQLGYTWSSRARPLENNYGFQYFTPHVVLRSPAVGFPDRKLCQARVPYGPWSLRALLVTTVDGQLDVSDSTWTLLQFVATLSYCHPFRKVSVRDGRQILEEQTTRVRFNSWVPAKRAWSANVTTTTERET